MFGFAPSLATAALPVPPGLVDGKSHCPIHIRMALQKLAYAHDNGSRTVDPKVRELALVSGIACVALGLAWIYEADYFAIFFFAAAAAIAIVEAVRRSV
jgi:hypothetical protein